MLTLDKILVKENRVDYYFSVDKNLQKYFNKNNHMFLEYNYDLSEIPKSILAIPFVSNVIPLIWITNSSIKINELDKTFLKCLDGVRSAYQEMYPKIKFGGNINVKEIVENKYIPEVESASLFSGGLDALTTFIRIKEKNPILITEYGWHGHKIEHSNVWEADKINAISFAKDNGLDNILIQSNYGTFIIARNIDQDFSKKLGDTWWHGLHHSLAIISAAIPIAFKLKLKCIYIASSNSPAFPVACASDPTVDNKIKYASGGVFHDGYELTRQDKVKVVVDSYSHSKELVNLRVCFKNKENCCKCEKCLRTIFGIIAEGSDPRKFGFNILGNFTNFLKDALNNEVKFFTDTFIIMYWEVIKNRMRENNNKILFRDLFEWFLAYEFKVQRKKSLLRYRIMNFFPILRRKITTKLASLASAD